MTILKTGLVGRVTRLPRFRALEFIGYSVVIGVVLVALVGEPLLPYDPNATDAANSFAPPTGSHPFGTDELGRDMLSRIVVGAQVVVQVSFGAIGLALVVGSAIGIAAALFGGLFESIIMRLTDILFAFPTLLLAIITVAVAGPGVLNAAVALAFVYMPRYVRTARVATLSLRRLGFVDAAYLAGGSKLSVGVRHIAPNMAGDILVLSGLCLSNVIIAYTALSFLGLGVQPPKADWGAMLNTAKDYLIVDPWLAVFPGIVMIMFILAINISTDALADRLNVPSNELEMQAK